MNPAGLHAQNLAAHLEQLRADGGLMLHNEWNAIQCSEVKNLTATLADGLSEDRRT